MVCLMFVGLFVMVVLEFELVMVGCDLYGCLRLVV